ncbi:MAG: hypothetical protein NTY09_02230, partial [bacterium]|nr:hypothetical protein [bacterium]
MIRLKIGAYFVISAWFFMLAGMATLTVSISFAQDELNPGDTGTEPPEVPVSSGSAFDFSNSMQTSVVEGLPWIENIIASHYGNSSGSCYGGYGNKLYPGTDYFVALPAKDDSLDYLGGLLGCRMSRCGEAQPTLDELLNQLQPEQEPRGENFCFWLGESARESAPIIDGWVIEGSEGEGLFRILEIKPAGRDGPILEAYVGDVGPWNQDDPYWEDYSRPDAEDGIDSHGRTTNRA